MIMDRFDLVREAFARKEVTPEVPSCKTSDYFGELVFDRKKMAKYLQPDVLQALLACMEGGKGLDRKTADGVARGMKQWAMEHGVTHVTHWFQPLTEGTAEKHDSLIDYDGKGGVIETFDGSMLAQQEPDASSFPSGGIRATFEARGYTAWDPTSPVFILDDTLCIPTVFIAYTGDALDYKTPLKRSLKAVSDAAVPVCRLFDPKVGKVYAYLGWEQEYFLVDETLYAARTDLMITGRTLFGHNSSKDQQLDDHYFASIPPRVTAYMRELEATAYRLGIPLKTRHNEVAPGQFEMAPIYSETNLANDQNQLIMNLMSRISRKHGFVVLLHEKPFDGVNGSGKHNNWSLGTDTGTMLLAPGRDALGNLQFVTFFVNVLAAVQKHNGLLKASIASATNAYRLGGNEAPPAIVSAFLGDTMTRVLQKLLEVPSDTPIEIAGKKGRKLGLVELPEIFLDNTDRNRTSPFAFIGNRFEFRAVGSSANCAGAMTTLNAAVADQLLLFKADVDRLLAAGKSLNVAVMDVLKPIIRSVLEVVCFDGNGYTDAWKEEAERRGLNVETSVPRMFCEFTKPESVAMFTRTGVYTERELKARNEVKWEIYIKKVQIEARVMERMAINHIVPAALEYKSKLLQETALAKEVYGNTDSCTTELSLLEAISGHVEEVRVRAAALKRACAAADALEGAFERAVAYHDVAESFKALRTPIDRLEELVDNKMWPLPKYRELLFIN
ncbi:MAG: glutamine synthetase III [Bacteroidales bacterium]|nr:glutamine synthetase III [Bacteroidales bacterium]